MGLVTREYNKSFERHLSNRIPSTKQKGTNGQAKGRKGYEKMNLEKAIERSFDKCNIIGINCDVYKVLYSYKVIRELPEKEIDAIYDRIVSRLGF